MRPNPTWLSGAAARSHRSADFRMLAGWFASCGDDGEAHRLARAAFALNPARHFSLNAATGQDLPANRRWLAIAEEAVAASWL